MVQKTPNILNKDSTYTKKKKHSNAKHVFGKIYWEIPFTKNSITYRQG